MKIHLWGTDYRRSSAEMRKLLFISEEEKAARHQEILSLGFTDLVYLTTCNRVEFYTTVEDYFTDSRPQWLRVLKILGLSEEDFYRGYHLEGKSATRHLLRVACSLESLVIGETQILGQLKDSYLWSKTHLKVHPSLERTFHLAFEVAKRVRTETAIGEKPVSVATLGFRHLEESEKKVPIRKAVVVGRGPISLSVIDWLKKNHPACPILWVNRSRQLLSNYSQSVGVEISDLASFLRNPGEFSHLFTATSSREPLFGSEFFSRVDSSPKQIFDFAAPSDVEKLELPGIEVVRIENLLEEAKANKKARAQAVLAAERIIEDALREHVLEQKEAPLLRDFGGIEPKFLEELESLYSFIENEFSPELHLRLKKMAEKSVRRNLHLSREHLRQVLRSVAHATDFSTAGMA